MTFQKLEKTKMNDPAAGCRKLSGQTTKYCIFFYLTYNIYYIYTPNTYRFTWI